jgi:hypothetical protein
MSHDMPFHDNRVHLITGTKSYRMRATCTFRGLMQPNILGLCSSVAQVQCTNNDSHITSHTAFQPCRCSVASQAVYTQGQKEPAGPYISCCDSDVTVVAKQRQTRLWTGSVQNWHIGLHFLTQSEVYTAWVLWFYFGSAKQNGKHAAPRNG